MKTDPSPKQHSHQRDLREVIMEVAGEIFAERGYDAATIKEITDRAGVNVASVNYYFRDKLGLYVEVLRGSLHRGSFGTAEEAGDCTPEEQLAEYIGRFMRSLLAAGRPSWAGRLMFRELVQPTPALPQVIEEIIRPNFIMLRKIVSEIAGCPLETGTLNMLTFSTVGQCVHWKTACPIIPYLWPDIQFDETQVNRIASLIACYSIAGIRAAASTETPPP